MYIGFNNKRLNIPKMYKLSTHYLCGEDKNLKRWKTP